MPRPATSLDTGATTAGEAWLVKFRTDTDPQEAGRIENAIARTARHAGIAFPDTMAILGASGQAHFAVRRFDRVAGRRVHVHSLAGLLHADFRHPSVDYETFLKATRILTERASDVEEAFRRAVFNVAIGNKDDHAKNHAYAMDGDGRWRLTPAFDVTPSEGPGGEHSMAVAGEGRRPGRAHLRTLAQTASIKAATVDAVIEKVRDAVAAFPRYAAESGVPDAATGDLVRRFATIDERFQTSR